MTSADLLKTLSSSWADAALAPVYGNEAGAARERYAALAHGLSGFDREAFREACVRVFTAAGRTELGGNHTDHNRGKVIAASIQLDAAAVVAPRTDKKVFFRSVGFPDVSVDLSDLSARPEEEGTTESLVRGIAAEFEKRGVHVSGWSANADSAVLPGSGLSSSAAVEVLFGKIFDCLYGGGSRSALEIAQIGQIAENTYFGKPSGLMDQAACASGGAVAIDFYDAEHPLVERVNFDPSSCDYVPVIVNTCGSHVDLTPDYAAVPIEMRAVAGVFGKNALAETTLEDILGNAPKIRATCGDRALLRAIHFHNENKRVDMMRALMQKIEDAPDNRTKRAFFREYLAVVNDSGHSSWELLQNMYSPASVNAQGLSAALALTREFLKSDGVEGPVSGADSGACRIHGGGFAGTIQSYIPTKRIAAYRDVMDRVFGLGAVTVLRIRPVGVMEVVF
ncbi:MAG: galactokinase [Spirochaetaceae bacterium]|jgi:galactokinase|nr:galactokinase [Spirochaetaceae bacterium]